MCLSHDWICSQRITRTRDDQTERVNNVFEDMIRSFCAYTPRLWSSMLPVVKFALNNTVHASTVYTPLYVNGLTHPCVPLALPLDDLQLDEGEVADWLVDVNPVSVKQQVSEFLATRSIVLQHVRDAMADSQDKHNEQADDKGRSCIESIMVDDQALMNTEILPANVVSAVYNTKL